MNREAAPAFIAIACTKYDLYALTIDGRVWIHYGMSGDLQGWQEIDSNFKSDYQVRSEKDA